MINIIVADDHTLIREGLKKLITSEPDLKLVGETSNPFEILDLIKKTKAEIIVLDISMPGKNGLDVLKDIKLMAPDTKVLIMTMLPEDQFAKRTLKAGAAGYLTKDSPPEELITAIRKIHSGRKYVSESLAESLAESLDDKAKKSPIELLSDREFQILKLIADGNSQTSIAERLTLGVSTVNTYRKRVLEKLKLKSNIDLIHFAIENNIIDKPG